MTTYNISAEIKTNTAPTNLYYEMELYKTDWNGNKTYALRPTGQHPLQADKKTKRHQSLNISDPQETCYILAITIYRKVGANFIKITQDPMTAITPLKGFLINDKDWGASREFEYYETTQQTQKSQQGQINTFQLNISSKPRVFEAKEHPIGDPLDPFTKQNVEDELKARMDRPALTHNQLQTMPYTDIKKRVLPCPYQNRSMFCGPSAFFYCIQKDRPDIYQQLIKELWETGETKIGSLRIEADKSVRSPKGMFDEYDWLKISAIDWMTMASLVDTENTALFSINSPSPGFLWWNWAGAITMWGVLEKWFKETGAIKIYDNISIAHSNLRDVCTLNNYVTPDNHVVSLIRAGMLSRGANALTKDHWIVWEGKLKLLNGTPLTTSTLLSERVQLKLFSWGEVFEQLDTTLTLGEFLNHTFGGLVFKKIP